MRRLQITVGLSLFLDAALYLSAVPLLPHYAHRFGLSKLGAALVLGAYPLTLIITSLPAGLLTSRVGARRMVIGGAACFTLSTVLFALAPNGATLAGARALQGVASAITWSAGLAWLTANAPPERRGAFVGEAMALLGLGLVAGPALGSLAGATSPRTAFLLAAAVSAAITALAWSCPAGVADIAAEGLVSTVVRALGHPLVVAAMVVGLVDSFGSSIIDLLTPFRLAAHGFSTTQIGGAFVGAALLGAASGPPVGRLMDRVDPLPVATVGAGALAVVALVLAAPLPSAAIVVALICLGPIVTAILTAAVPLASAGADRLGLGHSAPNALVSVAWSSGAVAGSLGGGAIAQVTGNSWAYVLAAAITALFVLVLMRLAPRTRAAVA